MLLPLALALALVPATLPPEAAEHNKKAMMFYDSGQLAPAFEEFHAAYASMPDAQAGRGGRESLLGSMRATLLEMHAASGEPAPLCRLREVLQAHADALVAAFPGTPDMLELRSARARHDEVTAQLAALGPDACAAAPPPPSAAPEPAATPTTGPTSPNVAPLMPPSPRASDTIPPRHLRIAGGITLGIGVVLLGVMAYGIVGETRHKARVNEIDAGAAGRPLSLDEHGDLLDHRREARSARVVAIGAGVAAGVMTGLGTTLFLLARRSARTQRWSAAPWWSPAGAGLTLRVQVGAAR